jgi:putative transposase
MGVAEIRRLQELEAENAKLKRLLAEQMLIVEGLREVNKKKW